MGQILCFTEKVAKGYYLHNSLYFVLTTGRSGVGRTRQTTRPAAAFPKTNLAQTTTAIITIILCIYNSVPVSITLHILLLLLLKRMRII